MISIRRGERKDAPMIACIEKEVMKAPWPLEVFDHDLS